MPNHVIVMTSGRHMVVATEERSYLICEQEHVGDFVECEFKQKISKDRILPKPPDEKELDRIFKVRKFCLAAIGLLKIL